MYKSLEIILARHNRNKAIPIWQLLQYPDRILLINIDTDDWGTACTGNLPENKHYAGKDQRMEPEEKKSEFQDTFGTV
jgi:hypothetical protein